MGGNLMLELKRKVDWLTAYHDVIEDIRRQPFDWSAHECASGLAARVVEAITGHDFAADYRGQYHDAASAYRVMRDAGFSDLADLAASCLPEYAHPVEAHIGDIVAVVTDTTFRHALGVMNGERIVVLTEAGLGTLDRSHAVRAFRVGDPE